jgi:hypothetical protein
MTSETRRKAAWAAFAIIGASLAITVPVAGLLGCSQANAQSRPAVEKAPSRVVLTESSQAWTPSVYVTVVHDSVSGREWIVFTRGDKFTEVRDLTYPENDRRHCAHSTTHAEK